ncbi:MAG: hypothetical protein ACK6AO_15150 [Planctomycetota bacterium]
MRLILLATLGADIAPRGPVHLRGGHHLLPICRSDGPENPSSHRESLTNPRRISKPELQ